MLKTKIFRLILVFLLILLYFPVIAQINPLQVSLDLGVGGGESRSDLGSKSSTESFSVGGLFKHPMGKKMQFKTGLLVENRNVFTQSDFISGFHSMKLLNVPLLYGVEFRKRNNGLSLLVGPNMGFVLTDEFTDSNGSLPSGDKSVSLSTFELGFISQADFFWDNFIGNLGFSIGFRGQVGLTNVIHRDESFTLKSNLFLINFGLRYSI